MKASLFITALFCIQALIAQAPKAQVFKLEGVNLFAKCLPEAEYEVVEEIKASGMLKSSKTNAQLIGAAGFNKFTYAMEKMNDLKLKAAKKGKTLEYDGAIMIKPNLIQFIKLAEGSKGAGYGKVGAIAIVEQEKKTGKYIYYASKPEDYYEAIADISYNQGGLGETMRGTSTIDISINGMLDKGKRWVRKGKIDSDFHAIILDWRALRAGKVSGELIKYPTN